MLPFVHLAAGSGLYNSSRRTQFSMTDKTPHKSWVQERNSDTHLDSFPLKNCPTNPEKAVSGNRTYKA